VDVVILLVASNLVLGLLICLFGWSKTATAVTGALRSYFRVVAGRSWGTYHRFLRGAYWESGERELFRTDVDTVSVFAIDRYTDVERHATCIVTDHRLMICDHAGTMVQIPLTAIRTARAQREYERDVGFIHAVAIDRGGASDHDPHGDVWLRCGTDRESHDLASSIHDAMAQLVSV
jgi:hypothetical protein